ncbi:Integral membrane protein TerC family protein [Haemophilus influenzae]|uniref:TerC family protein n=1 Tax=Haemophilus influenzae TaxID=727 RepID=UPI000CFE8E75|nr:TerC family protein [Haemophilus influenzae]PRI66586.1 Integral membrane protein TerC family protein [Haemophilus influenzae]PRJ93112.1 Integral membrane protein TerC family protein [Haemophilus influenzae]PRJ94072.1 Integral membrane protein TerC family protein [Haemophilus influenzae]PRK27446.1 Integral membrane protein TerC family protein [Haemophilus influenzae]PRM48017.1 Integral membrane protein TerC family protein [Haemophilus influenzae]
MFEWITDPEAWISLATLAALEIVLGVDNIIFISILVGRLPERQRQSGRIVGLGLAMLTRILLLMSLAWMMKLTAPLFTVFNQEISGRDLILLIGGLFLIIKSSGEIKEAINHQEHHESESKNKVSYLGVLIQIAVLDIVFSLDSVITAVGMASHLPVMILAIMIAVGVMMFAAKPIGDFVDTHPTLKILALAFLILVGISLIAESLDIHIPKGYIYFAMGFSIVVEMINIRMRRLMK